MIEFRGVSKRFDDGTEAVHVLDLVASEGQITVLVGPSGCGKTTSLRMVNRMVEPSSGTVLFGGRNVRSQSRLSCAGASATSSSRPGCSRTASS